MNPANSQTNYNKDVGTITVLIFDHVCFRIESVKKEDKGMYQCFIRNDQESAGASAELKLGGRCKMTLILRKNN